jgi:hypothetical protein
LAAALTLMTTGVAFGDEVPFAAPPPTPPGQPDTSNVVSLGDSSLGETQLRHIKLWYAGKSQNWELAGYEIDRIVESLRRAAYLYVGILRPIRWPECATPSRPKMPRSSSKAMPT